MNRRFSLAATERRFATRVLDQRNRVSPRIDYEAPSDDVLNFETELVQAKMRNMTPEEAAAFSAQAVAEAEAAMIEAAEAMWEAETTAAEAEVAAAALKKMKASKKRCMEETGTRVNQLEERSSD